MRRLPLAFALAAALSPLGVVHAEDLMQTYQGYKQQGVQLQPTTEQLVQSTLAGAGVNTGAQQGTGQNGQQTDQMVNQLGGMMSQYNNLTGQQYS